ncbi:MAG: MOSC domain-containing protein [Chloroflexi bacterium]|nr:MOSC domain-containing protein [Chloroflexota bacterium]
MKGTIVAVCTSKKKGIRKRNVGEAKLKVDWGIVGDAHADDWHRQVSLLALESIEKMQALGLNVGPGSFAENLTTQGLDLLSLPIGSQVRVGDQAILEITQHGKICHDRCAVYYQAGDCVMPREGIFARVIKGGQVKAGDAIETVEATDQP